MGGREQRTVSASGWKRAWLTAEWAEMMDAARKGRFDLLVVSYFSRFLRNVKQALVTIEDELHPAGVALFAVSERILTSDPDDWHAMVEEATDAEKYSRRMGKRMAEGHATRRRQGEPGGHPPFGYERTRVSRTSPTYLVEVPERIAMVRAMFGLAAAGLTDRGIAEQVGRKRTWVAEVLTNDFYRGVLTDGSVRLNPVISAERWASVQEQRSRYSRRHSGRTHRRTYVLSALLFCRACGHSLTGHVGRYRHYDACEEFKAQRPRREDPRHKGESYTQETFESVVPAALKYLRMNAKLILGTKAAISAMVPTPDPFALARVARARRAALDRFVHDRDIQALTARMNELDNEELAARPRGVDPPDGEAIDKYLTDLPGLYRSASTETRQRIARALFERVEALGPRRIWLTPSVEAAANGWTAAMTGEFTFETESTSGRGERI